MLAVHIVAVFAIVFSVTYTAVLAWFYRDSSHPFDLNPSQIEVEFVADDDESPEIHYTLPAATVYTLPGQSNPAGEDAMFNACVRRTAVSIKNVGSALLKIRFYIEITGAETRDKNNTVIPRNSSAPYALHYAAVHKSADELEAPAGLDAYGYPQYRENINRQMTEGAYTSLAEMNENIFKDMYILPSASGEETPENKLSFVIALWVDYFDLQAEFGYAPNLAVMSTVYSVKLVLIAMNFKVQ